MRSDPISQLMKSLTKVTKNGAHPANSKPASSRPAISPRSRLPLAATLRMKPILLAALLGFISGRVILGSSVLIFPITIFAALIPQMMEKRRRERRQAQLAGLWPEILDHIISGLRSGLSIAETLVALSTRGPELSRPIFKECQIRLTMGSELTAIFNYIKKEFNDPVADQVCEVLDFARGAGSRDTAITLRTLGDFIRSDIAVRGEIQAKLGWIKNSALVAALAPWILLLILSSQPSTLQAFSTSTGTLIIFFGILMSLTAYLWMSRVGRVRTLPRIFLGTH